MKNLIFRSEVINLLATKLYSPLAGIELTKGTLGRLQIDVRTNCYILTVQRNQLDIKTADDKSDWPKFTV